MIFFLFILLSCQLLKSNINKRKVSCPIFSSFSSRVPFFSFSLPDFVYNQRRLCAKAFSCVFFTTITPVSHLRLFVVENFERKIFDSLNFPTRHMVVFKLSLAQHAAFSPFSLSFVSIFSLVLSLLCIWNIMYEEIKKEHEIPSSEREIQDELS